MRSYYHGFANATLWPLLHDAIERPRFERSWWDAYRQANAAFADATLAVLDENPGALAWIHDYRLMLVPQLIRQQRPSQPVGFFLHVPWPSPDIFARLPWRREVLLGLLRADVVSFHMIDGMNLVAKEYVTVQQARRGSGRLVLSEFTGAAVELREAVMCNPFDVEGLSQRIEHAISLPPAVGRAAIAAMARRVAAHDVHRWVADQLADITFHGYGA